MTEVSSRWVLQEVFVDPSVEEEESCTLTLTVTSKLLEKTGNRFRVAVELSGSVVGETYQVANVRFVNVSEIEAKSGTRAATVLKRTEKRKFEELLSLLPFYLLKAGIVVKGLRSEL